MAFAIKAKVCDPRAKTFAFTAQKTMYGGQQIAEGDMVFGFASENEGGQGLIARGVVTSAEAIAKKAGIARQTPRVSITIRHTSLAKTAAGARSLDILPTGMTATRDRAQFQVLSSGNEQGRPYLGCSGGVPRPILLATRCLRFAIRACGSRARTTFGKGGLAATHHTRARAIDY
jgi:hypothetical protein